MSEASVAASEEPLLMVESSCSSSVAAVTEELNEPNQIDQRSRMEQSSKSTSAIITETSSNSNTTSKSDDSSILAAFDSSVSFYDRWNHEIHVLRATIDEKIGILAEQSQREIERIAAQMTGYQSPLMKGQSAASKYKITDLGPKVPKYQRVPRNTNKGRRAIDDRNLLGAVTPSTGAPLERVLSQLSSSQVMITASPSGRSHATGTSDKTVPQSNLSKHKQKNQPTSIRQVMSIPEESSLPNESDGGEDQRPPNAEDSTPSLMSPTSEDEDMEECELNDEDQMLHPPYHSSDDSSINNYLSAIPREGHIRGLTILTSHSEVLGDDESKPMMTSIPSLPLSSTSFPTYVSSASPKPQPRSPPKPFYRFFDTIRELRTTREHRPWYQMSRDAPTLDSPRPDAPSKEQQTNETEKVKAATDPLKSIDSASVTMSPSTISSSRSPTSILSEEPPIMSKSEALPVEPPSMTNCKEVPKSSSLHASPENSANVSVVPDTVVGPPPKRRKSPPLPEIFQRRLSTEKLPRCSPKLEVTPVESSSITEEKQESPFVDAGAVDDNDDNDIVAPCLDIVVFNQERKIVPHCGSMDASVLRMEYVTDRLIQDPYHDEGSYTGILIRGKPDSYGTMVYKDGRTYSGAWKRGQWNGYGKATFVNGDSYTGDYVQDQRHGVGRYEWSDGRVYDGRFEKDQREGQGTYSWSNGSVYCGEFHSGLRHGYGTYTYEDGSIYNGKWQNGKQHGTGECVWADGRCFRGEWLDGHAHMGIEVRANGTIRHNGEWCKDRPVRKSKSKRTETTQQSKELNVSNSC